MGKGGDDDEPAAGGSDARLYWMAQRVGNALRLKPDKLKAFSESGENRDVMTEFLDKEREVRCYVLEGKGLQVVREPPEGLKKKSKSFYFLKLMAEKITMENIDQLVISGDISDIPLEHFSLVANEVYLPLLVNTSVNQRWPEVLAKEVMSNFHHMLANLYVTIGETNGSTLLPLPPPSDADTLAGGEGQERIHALENSIINWTRQIKNILKADPESQLKAGKNVGPEVEIEFWKFISSNLTSIHEQLVGEKINGVIGVLEETKSAHVPAFRRLCEDVASAMNEANDNVKFLKPLVPLLEKLRDSDDFEELGNLFMPIMHTIMLIWKHSGHYNSPSRLVLLMREICNDLIRQARNNVNPESILEDEPQDAVDKLLATLRVCSMLKTAYFKYKTRVSVECPEKPWRFQNSALFNRLDSFLERCHDILELVNTKLQYMKLEKIEVGGTKGKVLTTSVAQIYVDFCQAISKFDKIAAAHNAGTGGYDILEVEAKEFDDDFYEFRVAIKEMERRLGAVVTQAFDDCTTVYSSFKLLDSFDTLLDREVIKQDLEKKHVDLVRNFGVDLKMVLDIFTQHKDKPVIGRNMPPVSGAVLWVRGLQERIQDPFEKFGNLKNSAVMETDETKETFKMYQNASETFKAYELSQFESWCKSIESVGQEKLKQPLLVKYTDGGFDGKGKGLPLLRVNFDPALVKLLREVRYFRLMKLDVPEAAMNIYGQMEQFRQQTGNLELIVNVYNRILLTLLDIEKPMLQKRLDAIDKELQKGLKFLTWKSNGIGEFISTTMHLVKESDNILSSINANVTEMKELLGTLQENVMFERKEAKTYLMEEFDATHESIVGVRHGEAIGIGEKVHKLVLASNKVLKISKGDAAWRAYVAFLGGIVVDGISDAVQATLDTLLNNLDEDWLAKHDTNALIEIKLELIGDSIEYTPSVTSRMGNELQAAVNSWIRDYTNMAKFIARLESGEGDYLMETEEDEAIMMKVCAVAAQLKVSQQECIAFMDTYRTFEYLWVNDIRESFDQFLLLAEEEGQEPTLEQFDAEITKYKALQEEVSNLPNAKTVGWLRVDAKPIKQALGSWVSQWSYRYTEHLLNRVTNNVAELNDFMAETAVTQEIEVPDGDVDTLLKVMGCIRDVRTRTEETDGMFEPLRNTVQLLKKWNIDVSEETLKGLEEAPMTWSNLKKQTFAVKEVLTPLQNAEAEKVKKQVDEFNKEVESFREEFKVKGPFAYSDKFAEQFKNLHAQAERISELEARALHLNEMQDLFDLNVTDYREIRYSRKDAMMLKGVWDCIAMVETTFEEYKQIKWGDIEVETLMAECKVHLKTVKNLDKYVKNWGAFKGLEDAVKNMMTALPLVEELKHPSMRDRHWKQLMRATGKSFTMNENFSMGDLLALKLFDFVEEVAEIVDRAQKELTIEKQLAKIEETWAELNLDFVPYGETEVVLVQASEELIEALDDSQVQLQNLGGSKYVAGNQSFQDQVNIWQSKLGAVDQTVRTTWLEVQKKWVGLEPIFIGSADIRVQLPEDSKRFDGTDGSWKELMKEAPDQPNAIEAATVDGRLELLETMLGDLELCEKSLADYLETKRLAFPRFYFVAPADLLDILSKGSSPWLLQKHFSKNFDSIQSIEFEQVAADQPPSKTALGMHSPQGEYVEFKEPLVCDGPVEVWLNKIMETMRLALREVLAVSSKTIDDKARDEWLFDYCAQIMVLVTRIVYTEDVGLAFDQLEEGNDNALKDYYDKCQVQLNKLSDLINGELTKGDRTKIITLVTIDVHARDVITKLIHDRVESIECFQWQSQLRYRIDEKTADCRINVCDFDARYSYEYIGNCGCLVITPLTDRCYITLTQASRLVLGGAPAGPAGTGKTETTKDLGRALGVMVYVFNCSDQMDYRSMAQIYKGLAQTGCWGCFDEFNRISIEVLSVCSTQYKTILDAIRATEAVEAAGESPRFVFDDEDIPLVRTTMAFITMNPGYAGRQELPESLKALFRPVSMVVPDMNLIAEIMLFAEGFKMGKILSRKFMLCYNLSADLLSKSDHYDWKLRAVKTTLNVAGGMKRAAPDLSEDKVLLRALRDFNIGKLLGDDTPIFMGLLNDLFPKTLDLVPRFRDPDFEGAIKKAAEAKGYQPEENVILKISQLREIFVVRWSVFLLGMAGCAKTTIWQTLQDAQNAVGEKSTCATLNPKGVTRNELYGYISMATREWKDGVLSQIFRDFSNSTTYQHEWIVLDGDIDAEWIESMNTVMDDNKLLTLASNERIPLTAPMRLLFEIGDLRNASPATVSRAGVIFVNEDDIGYMPFVYTWLEKREDDNERSTLVKMFEKYVAPSLDAVRKQFKTTIPIVQINMVCTLCYLLDGLLGDGSAKGEHDELAIEAHFAFASVWAFGGALLTDKSKDNRALFSQWWKDEFKTIKFPDDGEVYDYMLEKQGEEMKMVPWTFEDYFHTPNQPIGTLFVQTSDTARLTFMLDNLMKYNRSVMFVGNAGTGKTVVMREKLQSLDADEYNVCDINLNCYTDSMTLQMIMEQQLEKKAGIVFGPPGNTRLIYFVDDLNMPVVDKYGTQEPIALLRQYVDYGMWYERAKLTKRMVKNCDLMACMNPTAGSFTIQPRLQRQFATFSCQLPKEESLRTIYGSILAGHLNDFDTDVQEVASAVSTAAVALQTGVFGTFLPSAVKFHYLFNLRDISSVFGGLLRSQANYLSEPLKLIQLYTHEANRVYRDRLITNADMDRFDSMLNDINKKYFSTVDGFATLAEIEPNIFTTFCSGIEAEVRPYLPVRDWEQLSKTMEAQLAEHNETNAVMNLVLFTDAMEHVSRIARIIEQPRGNALLVGVGGSGKQSLAKLAAFISTYEVFQITITASYKLADFKENLQQMYMRAGVKGIGTLFLFTDQQVVDERFLVLLNDMLSSGDIPDLFPPEEIDNINNAIRGEVKQAGLMDTKEECWGFFIEKVRRLLHVALCFSPVGDKFRVRARQFPALVSCTQIDWFHAWSQEALVMVAHRFLRDIEGWSDELKEGMAAHMSFVHTQVSVLSDTYFETERRRNYVTPKSFLELIDLYKSMLSRKLAEIGALKERLESGLEKLQATAEMVAELQEALKADMAVVEEKKAATDKLLVHVGQETQIAEDEKAKAAVEEEKCDVIAQDVKAVQEEAEADLMAAEPIIAAAEEALNSLNKGSLTELKAFGSPAEDVVMVTAACVVLTAGSPPGSGAKVPKDLSWAAAKKMMGNVGAFLDSLIGFDKDNLNETLCEYVEKNFVSQENFTREVIETKSGAAAGLCDWCINICKYFRIYQMVAPKRAQLAEANAKLDAANNKLAGIRKNLAALDAKLADLTDKFETATEDKNNAIATAEASQKKADLADRLVNGLADEGVRWKSNIEEFAVKENTMIGDAMLASAFVSYIGSFNTAFREKLVSEKWVPDLVERQIPMTDAITPVQVLCTEADQASWAIEKLPADEVSIQNGAIITNCARWPLMIDPQLQGIGWILEREGKGESGPCKVVQLSTPKYLDQVEFAIQNGEPIIIENMPDAIDAVLDPILARQTIKKGRNFCIKLGDKEVDYDPKFQLYMQTKLANPHYIPEVQAQCTMVNFTVTESGLEDQLLALVVDKERPDLEAQRAELIRMENEFKVQLVQLEDNLLFRLANAEGDILEDIELIENLEETKVTSLEIQEKVKEGKETAKAINVAREVYRPVASRGSLLFFLVDKLNALEHMYQFSMANFVDILNKGIDLTEKSDDLKKRIDSMVDVACFTVFAYVSAGLFEQHKLIFASELCFKILKQRGEIDPVAFDFLLRGPMSVCDNPCSEWLPDDNWYMVKALEEQLEQFANISSDLEGSAKRWREFIENPRAETEPLPGDWKRMGGFDRLLAIRALRPDRMADALSMFVADIIGAKYTMSQPFNLEKSFEDTRCDVPVFFFLSPGVDVMTTVEQLHKKMELTEPIATVSLGQGQEPVAERAIEAGTKSGSWVALQNIHLTPSWTKYSLEKRLDKLAGDSHENFRLFLSAEPSPAIPISILQACVKLTNEPPEGMQANVKRSLNYFNDEMLEECSKQSEFKCITFGLVYFHACLLQRKKFGTIGWNFTYPFSTGDLVNSSQCAVNYLENNSKIPWSDLRYLFGEILYGGHVFNDWDRVLVNTYLNVWMTEAILESIPFFPGFMSPPPLNMKGYHEYIEESFPAESPACFGLHSNAEIGFRLMQAAEMFTAIQDLQPKTAGGEGSMSREDKSKMILDEILEKLPDDFDMLDITDRLAGEDRSPFTNVFLQEIERMNILLKIMKVSLFELDLGLKGDLTISDAMETLMDALFLDRIPTGWEKKAYPSKRALGSWVTDVLERAKQLQGWVDDMNVPKVTWFPGFFNPQSFLTAVQQQTARKNEWPLDKTVVVTDVTKKRDPEEIDTVSRDGAYICGMTLEGCRWDDKIGALADSHPKELFAPMPVMLLKAVTVEKAEQKDMYNCPVYKTKLRPKGALGHPDGGYIFTANLKTKEKAEKWVMAGVALLTDTSG